MPVQRTADPPVGDGQLPDGGLLALDALGQVKPVPGQPSQHIGYDIAVAGQDGIAGALSQGTDKPDSADRRTGLAEFADHLGIQSQPLGQGRHRADAPLGRARQDALHRFGGQFGCDGLGLLKSCGIEGPCKVCKASGVGAAGTRVANEVQSHGVSLSVVTVTEAEVREALRPVQDPELHRSIVDLGMYRGAAVEGGHVDVRVALTVAGCPLRSEIQDRVSDALRALDGVTEVTLDFTVMSDEERAELRGRLHGDPAATAGSAPAHGHAQGRAVPFAEPGNRTRTLLIASGKGGVGKSAVTANLSIALASKRRATAVVDADVWGFSMPRMLGVDRPPTVIDGMIVPPEVHGVRCISMGFFAREDQPVIWRGPMLHKALEQFLTDVFWDDPDYLLVDLPPGTGDISLSLSQFLPRAEVYIVTTPNAAAQRVAQRAAFMFEKVDIAVRGVIENMCWFTADDGKRYPLFGAGGGADLARRLDVELIGQVPLDTALRSGSDHGSPIMATGPDSEATAVFAAMADWIEAHGPTRRTHPELRIV